ncbi:9051_t:CDS:2 [Cetraspora pellucida]|uniref:9051_t:CDS:1 n=1 Tax=Cetraspora pellucida TaxID=1433469 RepID=A0ACA9L0L7_9GLOM|nr:9051_t:CDS:2 [Cetraspora pellucida]
MFCTWCEFAKKTNRFIVGCEWLKHNALIQHLTTQDHKKTKHHYATHGLKDLKNLSTQQFNEAKNEALFGPFVSLKKVQSIMDPPNLVRSEYEAISFVIEESLSNEIQNSPYWSIQIDESNTIKQEKMLAIVSKHLSDNYPVVQFLGIIQLDDAAAQSIVNNINHFLMAKKLDISYMYHMESDGASTMIGKKNGIATIFKKQNPFLLEHYCIAHRLALAAKDAAEKVPYFENYNSIVNNLYSYFSSSYKRMINLQLVEQTIDDPNLVLLFTISEVYMHLNATINSITTQYIGHNGIPPNYENFLREYIDEQNILIEDLPDFILQFAVATVESLQDRFPNSEILNSLRIFDPCELPSQYNQIHSYGNSEICSLANFYRKPKKLNQIEYPALIDNNSLTKE